MLKRFVNTIHCALLILLPLSCFAANEAIGEITHYRVKKQDTLHDIARTSDLGIIELLNANPKVDRWQPKAGTLLTLPTLFLYPPPPREGIIINLAEMRLYYFPSEVDEETMSFPIGPGHPNHPTPIGHTFIKKKRANPIWVPPQSIRDEKPNLPKVIAAGPHNPLGEYALNLAWPRFVIHGTNQPWSVGSLVSHGCIRMYPEDIEKLFHAVPEETSVLIIDDKVSLGWVEGALYMDVHTPRTLEKASIARQCTTENPNLRQRIITVAGERVHLLDWYKIDRELIMRTGIPIRITVPQ